MIQHLFCKIVLSIIELPRLFLPTRHPKVVMTLLVKNEEQLLEANLQFHKAQGVDGFIITDNNSTDRTPHIIEKYRQKGWVLEAMEEKGTNYAQKRWVDRMVWAAKRKYKADWVINADADEFWYSPQGLKAELQSTRANVLAAEVRNVLPEEELPWYQWPRTVRAVADREQYGLSLYSVFAKMYKKVCHRTAGYLQISMGNHKVAMLPKVEKKGRLVIYHYHVRERAHFLQKMINGGRQLEANKGKGGRHWRYYYDIYKSGQLEAEYDKVVGRNSYTRLLADGYIHEDNIVPHFLAHIGFKQNLQKPTTEST